MVALAVGAGAAAVVAALLFARGLFATAPPAPAATTPRWDLVARDTSGAVVLRVALTDGRFTLRYRNSVYGSLAEERFAVNAAGEIQLVELAADEAALLGEYYVDLKRPQPATSGDPRRWRAVPRTSSTLGELPLAATAVGQRTLIAAGQPPIALWPLVPTAEPGLVLRAEKRE